MSKQEFFSINEVKERLGISRMTVYRLRDSGKLHFHKFGRVYRCSEADLQAYINNSTSTKQPGEETA